MRDQLEPEQSKSDSDFSGIAFSVEGTKKIILKSTDESIFPDSTTGKQATFG